MSKAKRIRQICKKDNELLHKYESGKLTGAEYQKRKRKLHGEYMKLTGEKKLISDLSKSCRRFI